MISKYELRIGNWFHGGWREEMKMQVHADHLSIWFGNTNMAQFPEPNPIEITDEILEKIGERKLVMGDTAAHWKIGGLLFREGDIELKKGLHWLQNHLYFRTGVELEVVW